ncbi:MAG: glycosyltransferase family 4 protein [Gammaproteobacteria bacterium]|nr:glycosyltransferase family 4 protein [Gammaproteobacteria bacterium]
MRILMVTEDLPHPAPGGLARHVLTLGQALQQAGHHVDYLGNGCSPTAWLLSRLSPGQQLYTLLGSPPRGWKERSTGAFNPYRRPYTARRYAQAVVAIADNYDVVHYHGHFPNIAHYLPSHINFVQTRHDQGSDCLMQIRFRNGAVCTETAPEACAECAVDGPNSLQRCVSAWAVRRFRREVVSAFRRHKVIFVSESIRRSWLRCAGPGEWGAVVHNFIDYGQVQAAQEQPPAIARRSRYNVFIAAKLYQPKGVGALLECLQGRLPSDMQLVIAGEGMQMSELQARYAGDTVTFLGWLDYPELLARCAGADLVVVPSLLEESCATTILEALALGRPTMSLARGGTPELQCYARYPGQLLLFDAMQDLADRLITYRECHTRTDWPDFCGDVAAGIPRILEIYRTVPE